jgi:hypothetical protein
VSGEWLGGGDFSKDKNMGAKFELQEEDVVWRRWNFARRRRYMLAVEAREAASWRDGVGGSVTAEAASETRKLAAGGVR